jgi:TolB protein
MDVNGSDVNQLTDLSVGCGMPFWSPVGAKIAFTNYGITGNDREIYIVEPDGSGLVNLTNNIYDDSVLGWSPDGTDIIFRSNRDQGGLPNTYDLYVMNSDGTNPVRLSNSGYVEAAAWSPDGTKIAYSQYTGPTGIFIINPDGSGQMELQCQAAPVDSFDFSWSPDSSKIAFVPDSSTAETRGIYIARVDNSSCSHINNLLARSPKWRPVP